MVKVIDTDAIVVGGGFYGSVIAAYLVRQRGLKKVLLVERESDLLVRASFNNQARVHNGYHYPRSFKTAFRSRVNLPRFLLDWPTALKMDFTQLYAIARNGSKVTSRQFERFCAEIGADLASAEPLHVNLFESRLIEKVYSAKEYAFDSLKIASLLKAELCALGVIVRYDESVTGIFYSGDSCLAVETTKKSINTRINTRFVFNCTYSGLNQISGDYLGSQARLKHEITEMALIQMPSQLENLGVTLMDGPFFSIMPFPSRQMHTLSHVRYTPHSHWHDKPGINPYHKMAIHERKTRVDRMLRDVGRYLPAIHSAAYMDSLYEVKTVLVQNENDDGRPILFEQSSKLPGCYSILGGKIDNIYDVIERLDCEVF